MIGKQKPRGIAKAKHLNAQRSKKDQKNDKRRTAKKIYRPTKEGIRKWHKNPKRSDIRHIDTKN